MLWFKVETHDQKVVSSNPGAGNRMDIFHINVMYNMDCLFKKTENK